MHPIKQLDTILQILAEGAKYKYYKFSEIISELDSRNISVDKYNSPKCNDVDLISRGKDITDPLLMQILYKLEAEKYITIKREGTRIIDYRITFDGQLFIEVGGYSQQNRNKRLTKVWTSLKIFATTLYSLAILYVGYRAYTVSDKTNKLEIELEKLKQENQELKVQLRTQPTTKKAANGN